MHQYTNFEEQYYQSEEYQAIREYWKTRLSGFDISGKEFAYGNLQTALSEVTASNVAVVYARKNQTTQDSILLVSLYLALHSIYAN